jgi:hypothetical protein
MPSRALCGVFAAAMLLGVCGGGGCVLPSPCSGQALPPSYDYAPGAIIVMFVEGATLEQAEFVVGLFGGYGVASMDLQQDGALGVWGTVRVPVGEELCWSDVFSALPIVESAQPNYLAWTQ